MTIPASLLAQVHQRQLQHALIIDDAYDAIPYADELAPQLLSSAADKLRRCKGALRTQLVATLERAGIEKDDFEEGLRNDPFVAAVWHAHIAGKLPQKIFEQLFSTYRAENEQKKLQLKPLEALLTETLQLSVVTQGREGEKPLPAPRIVFLDLYLGITDHEEAVELAAERIRELTEGIPHVDLPLVIVMSTTGGTTLAHVAKRLQQTAGLMGCKFRAINKAELSVVLPEALSEMLSQHEDAQVVAKWLDSWDAALGRAHHTFLATIRLLDLSDLAYLKRYRLEVESVDLGSYLRTLADGFLLYCIEGERQIAEAASMLDTLQFKEMPMPHFLPSQQVPKLKHAASFLNEELIAYEGWQFEDARKKLKLGDLIVEKPKKWREGQSPVAPGTAVFVVISQACDIQQGKADTFLLLRGELGCRDWTKEIKPSVEETDIYILGEEHFYIGWHKAQIAAWSAKLAEQRLSKSRKGGFLRIARFRDVEALKLQNLFAANLTRVGLPTWPHLSETVGLKLVVPVGRSDQREIFSSPFSANPAALVYGKMASEVAGKRKSSPEKRIIFSRHFATELSSAIETADWAGVDQSLVTALKALAASPAQLKKFDEGCEMNKQLAIGQVTMQLCFAANAAQHRTKALLIVEPQTHLGKTEK